MIMCVRSIAEIEVWKNSTRRKPIDFAWLHEKQKLFSATIHYPTNTSGNTAKIGPNKIPTQ